MLPVVLDGATHHEQIALAEEERQGAATTAWSQQERPGRPDAHDGDEGIDLGVAHAVPVPGHAVRPGPVVVAADRVELPAVAAATAPGRPPPAGGAGSGPPPPSTTRPTAAPGRAGRTWAPCAAATAAGPPARRRRGPSPPAIGAGGPASSSRPAPAGARPATTGRTRARRRRTGWPATRPCPAGPSRPAARSPNVRPPGDRRRGFLYEHVFPVHAFAHYRRPGAPARGFSRPVPTLRRCRLRR